MTDISLSTDETRETWTRVFRYLYKNLFSWTDLPSIFLFSYQLAFQFWDHYSKPSSGLKPRGNRNQRLNDLLFSWWNFFIQILLFSYTCVTFVNVVNKFDFYLLENVHAYIWFIHVFLLYHVIHIDTKQKKNHHLVNIIKYSQTLLSRARQDCLKISSIWEFEISRVKYF